MLGQIGAKTTSTSRVNSRSFFKEKLMVIEIQDDPNTSDIDENLYDILKVDRKIQHKYSIQSRVPPLGWPISLRRYMLRISGGIYGHAIVTGPATIFM